MWIKGKINKKMIKLFYKKKVLSVLTVSSVGVLSYAAWQNQQPQLNQVVNQQENKEEVVALDNNLERSSNYQLDYPEIIDQLNFKQWIDSYDGKKSFLEWAKDSEKVKDAYLKSSAYQQDLNNFKVKLDKTDWLMSQFAKPFVNDYAQTREGLAKTFAEFAKTKTFNDWGRIWSDKNNEMTKKEWFDNDEISQFYFQKFKDKLSDPNGEWMEKYFLYEFIQYEALSKEWGELKPEIGYEDNLLKWEASKTPQDYEQWLQSDEGLWAFHKWVDPLSSKYKEKWEKTPDYFIKLEKWLSQSNLKSTPTLAEWKESSLSRPYYNKYRFSTTGYKTLKDKWIAASKPKPKDLVLIKAPKFTSSLHWGEYFHLDHDQTYEEFSGVSFKTWSKKKANLELLLEEFKKTELYKWRKKTDNTYGTQEFTPFYIAQFIEKEDELIRNTFLREFLWNWAWKEKNALPFYYKDAVQVENFEYAKWSAMTTNGISDYEREEIDGVKTIEQDYNHWKDQQKFTKKDYEDNHLGQKEKDFQLWFKNNDEIKKTFRQTAGRSLYSQWKQDPKSHRLEANYKKLLKYKWSSAYDDFISFIKLSQAEKYHKLDNDEFLKTFYWESSDSNYFYHKWKMDHRRSEKLGYVDGYLLNKQSILDYPKWMGLEYGKLAAASTEFNKYNAATLDEQSYQNNSFNILTKNIDKWVRNFDQFDQFFGDYKKSEESKDDLSFYKWENDLPSYQDNELTILHTNDTHAYVSEGRWVGMGFAKVAAIVKNYKRQYGKRKKLLVLDGGDFIGGQVYATLTQGDGVIPVLNQVGYDAAVLGNHEFDFGSEALKKLMLEANFPFLSANGRSLDDSIKFPPYRIFKRNGLKVGVFGLTTPETYIKAHPDKVKNFAFDDPITTAKDMVKKLKKEGVDYIVALGHMGDDPNAVDGEGKVSPASRSSEIVKAVPEIDVFVDGHTHQTLHQPLKIGNSLILQAGDKTKYIGKLEVKILPSGKIKTRYKLISKKDAKNVVPDPKVEEIINEWTAKIDVIKKEKIGENPFPKLIRYGPRDAVKRVGIGRSEMPIGNLIAKAMLEDSKADFALTNGGGIRATFPGKGATDTGPKTITKGDIISILPFGNVVTTIEVTGAELKAALEMGLSNVPGYKGAFPHIAGFKVEIDKDNKVSKLVKDDGTPIVDLTTYTLATNDFVAVGGDGYLMFKGKFGKETSSLDQALIDLIKKYPIVYKADGSVDTTKTNWYDYSKLTQRVKKV